MSHGSAHGFNVDPRLLYDGPEFEEFCISVKGYLSARRDRGSCATCALSNLCQAGFEHQVSLVVDGEDPSLTKDCQTAPSELTPENLFSGLTDEQIAFVRVHVPGLNKESDNV
ncbi:hypothetical protein [Tardiphaga robiniae]|nr:hypothetical protein [Tardiphaga robiniae]